MDERRGRQEAENRGLKPIGTLGVLVAAHNRRLIDLSVTIDAYDKRVFTLVRSCLRQLLIAHYLQRKEISNGVVQLLGSQWFVSKNRT
jgi:predicted nucleic acid-binding protein